MPNSFATPWTVVHQAPLLMEFSRQEYWSGLPFPSLGIFLIQGLNLSLFHWQADSLPLSHKGRPIIKTEDLISLSVIRRFVYVSFNSLSFHIIYFDFFFNKVHSYASLWNWHFYHYEVSSLFGVILHAQ